MEQNLDGVLLSAMQEPPPENSENPSEEKAPEKTMKPTPAPKDMEAEKRLTIKEMIIKVMKEAERGLSTKEIKQLVRLKDKERSDETLEKAVGNGLTGLRNKGSIRSKRNPMGKGFLWYLVDESDKKEELKSN